MTRLVFGSALLAALVVVSQGGAAVASDVADATSGRAWLVEASTDRASFSGALDEPMAAALRELGGAVLISGRAGGAACELAVDIAGSRQTVSLSAQVSVVYLEVQAGGVGATDWSMEAISGVGSRACKLDLEGAVLFVGEASAYVGEDPSAYWASVQGGREVGVR